MPGVLIDGISFGWLPNGDGDGDRSEVNVRGPSSCAVLKDGHNYSGPPDCQELSIEHRLNVNATQLKCFEIAVNSLDWKNKDGANWPKGSIFYTTNGPAESFTYNLEKMLVDVWTLSWSQGGNVIEELEMRVWKYTLKNIAVPDDQQPPPAIELALDNVPENGDNN